MNQQPSASTTVAGLARTLKVRRQQGHRPPIVLDASGQAAIFSQGQMGSSVAMSETDLLAQNRLIWDQSPLPSHRYLAELVLGGYLDTVLQLGHSYSYERALARVVEPGNYLRFTRGEQSDDYIARALSFDRPRARLIRLYGDIVGRTAMMFPPTVPVPDPLAAAFVALINNCDALILGDLSELTDGIRDLLARCTGVVWSVPRVLEEPKPANIDRSLPPALCPGSTTSRGTTVRHREVDGVADNAELLRGLCLLLARSDLEILGRENRKLLNDQVRSRQPIDATYSDRLIQRLAHEIREACDDWSDPTLLVFVHDPDAPGGSEIEKRIKRHLGSSTGNSPDLVLVTVHGGSVRWIDRRSEEIEATEVLRANYSRAVVIDSVSFTGRTLSLATESVRRQFPGIEIFWAALIISQSLVKGLEGHGIDRDHLLSVFESDRHDIFFPWGWTHATSSITRSLPVHLGDHPVVVDQRQWGTIEVLAHEMQCSVRLNTIRAGNRMNLNQHSLRDEIFVVLDDHLGLEFESEDGRDIHAAILSRGEYLAVPRGVRYRLAAYRDSVRVLEVAFGMYDEGDGLGAAIDGLEAGL